MKTRGNFIRSRNLFVILYVNLLVSRMEWYEIKIRDVPFLSARKNNVSLLLRSKIFILSRNKIRSKEYLLRRVEKIFAGLIPDLDYRLEFLKSLEIPTSDAF